MKKTADDYYRYAKKHYNLLLNRDFSSLKLLSSYRRLHAMYSLSSLSKFLGIHKEFKMLRESYGLKWSRGNTDQLIIKRLLRYNSGEELKDWIVEVKERIPELSGFVDLITATGLRYVEALNSYNIIIDLAEKGKLGDYYNNSVLEHYKYPEIFIRRTKKVFISIAPRKLIEEISKSDNLTHYMIKMKLQHRKIPIKFSDLREYWASKMTRHLSQPEIDFLMGHMSANVFMLNYFNPTLINDLKERALEGIRNLL